MYSLTNHTLAKHAIVLLCIQPQKDGFYVPIDLGIGVSLIPKRHNHSQAFHCHFNAHHTTFQFQPIFTFQLYSYSSEFNLKILEFLIIESYVSPLNLELLPPSIFNQSAIREIPTSRKSRLSRATLPHLISLSSTASMIQHNHAISINLPG
jgi:hypothetical protein